MTWLLLAAAVVLLPPPAPPAVRPNRGSGVWRHSLRRAQFRDEAIAFVLAAAGELRGGSDPNRAILVAAQRYRVATAAARAARIGGDVPAGLRVDAEAVGASLLTSVAGAWELAARTGAGMADVLEHLADGYRRTVEVRRTLAVELASPRASARIMSLLPAMGLALALLLGADPLRWLTTTPLGLGCLLAGAALNALGYLWIRRIVRALEDRS